MTIPESPEEFSSDSVVTPQELGVWLGLVETVDSVRSYLDEQIRDVIGISIVQFGILQRLLAAPSGRLSMTEIADGQASSRSGITYQIDRLEAQELARRTASPRDERSVEVAITPLGRETLARFQPSHNELLRHLVLDHVDQAQLDALERVVASVRAHLSTAPPRSVRRRTNHAKRG